MDPSRRGRPPRSAMPQSREGIERSRRSTNGGVEPMTDGASNNTSLGDASKVDLEGLRKISGDIVGRMQTLRELLEARAAALEACRASLDSYHGELKAESAQ